ncbi:enoyl-CoA hydratase/isomerase family protein [Thalassotalea mangrovi]|uniref:Enoyl-CoA hydratase/isomerase family protein n=1 Tax=Thalassotalea mangrovi TaxID=2572245 RepID=A0A4U1B1Y0_9GAMM|nr:enoyl-CoA hydratase/isomerase family protein [Thalassotalea mangrovi]TKB43269.1 enoyl-CoA hydratase/isomerase family protein [Thalassotalea mangrovi]
MSKVRLELSKLGEQTIAHMIIDRADKHNAMNQAMWGQFEEYCLQLQQEIKPRVAVVSAVGDLAFCSGADIKELQAHIDDSEWMQINNEVVQRAQLAIEQLSCPTIAAINGHCVGGGMGIALACDFRIAASDACFAITPAKLGLLYSLEDTRRLVDALGSAKARELLFTGKSIDCSTAMRWGLLTECVTGEQLTPRVDALVMQLCAASRTSIEGMKLTLGFLCGRTIASESEIRQLFDQAFTGRDFIQASLAFKNNRQVDFN